MKLSSITLWADNPRKITDEAFEKLKNSLKKDLVYLKENPIKLNKMGKELIVYAGNQRVKALRELGYEEIDDKYFTIVEIDEATMIERGIKDNEGYGEYDREKLYALSKKMHVEFDMDISKFDIPNTSIYRLTSMCNGFEVPTFDDDLSGFKIQDGDGVEQLEEENKTKKREQNYVVRTEIIFNDQNEKEYWNYFLHFLGENYGGETVSARLTEFIKDKIPKKGAKK